MASHGLGNPRLDLQRASDPLQRILQNPVSQGIHLVFFRRDEDSIEIIDEGGVYIADKDWPSLYWLSREDENEDINSYIAGCINNFWWSIPRKDAELIVDANILLKNSQGEPQPIEQLHAYGVDDSFIPLELFAPYYGPDHFMSVKIIPVLTTIPCLGYSLQPVPSSYRPHYRQLKAGGAEA